MTRTINFNWKQLGRALVCFALIVCLLVNVSPLRAKASAVVYGTAAIASTLVVASVIMGTGVLPGPDSSAFTELVSNTISALNIGSVIDVVTWVASGFQKYAVPASLVESIRRVVIEKASVSRKSPARGIALGPGGSVTVGNNKTYRVNNYCEVYCAKNLFDGYGNFLFLSKEPFAVNGSSAKAYNGFYYKYYDEVSYSTWVSSGHYVLDYAPYGAYNATGLVDALRGSYQGDTVNLAQGLIADYVADEAATLANGYAGWYANSVTVPGTIAGTDEDDEEVALPIAPGKTWGDTIGKTQTDVWAGAGSWEDTQAGTGTDTESGTISGTITIPGINALVNFFTGTAIVESPLTAIRFGALFDLFPFNIPKGIYDTINFWNASAAPPVISIPLPNVTRGGVDVDTYELDFAEIPGMNTLAALIRGGELILFAIGLLMITRKVTKW